MLKFSELKFPKNEENNNKLPMVSICTPTFNRRPFIPMMLNCYRHQTYPKDKMEWIIVDDGTDKIEDIINDVKDIPNIKYIKFEEKMNLGKKRNIAHQYCNGEIILYMDDDDYYPIERVSHAVEVLMNNPKVMIAGSTVMYIYFKHINEMYKLGPYRENHATAATFAFRKQMLNDTTYEDDACMAEEKFFLKNYTVPLVQLDPLKTILVFSHNHNSFDKKLLLNSENTNKFTNKTSVKISDFIKDNDVIDFVTNKIDSELESYSPGEPKNKPDVLIAQANIQLSREKAIKEMVVNDFKKLKNDYNSSLQKIQELEMNMNLLIEKNNYLQEKIKTIIKSEISNRKQQTISNDN